VILSPCKRSEIMSPQHERLAAVDSARNEKV
jgi:hypothetical protein